MAEPYHIISHCTDLPEQKWSFSNMDLAWSMLLKHLEMLNHLGKGELQVYAMVLMSNHLHLLGAFSEDLSHKKIREFLSSSFFFRSGGSRGGEMQAFAIKNVEHYRRVYKYILRNPVTAKLVTQVEDYPYSSLAVLSGQSVVKTKGFIDQMNFINSPKALLTWLNQPEKRGGDTAFTEQYNFSKRNANNSL